MEAKEGEESQEGDSKRDDEGEARCKEGAERDEEGWLDDVHDDEDDKGGEGQHGEDVKALEVIDHLLGHS